MRGRKDEFKKGQNRYTVLLIVGIVVLIGGTALVKVTDFDNLIGVISGLGGAWIGISSIRLYLGPYNWSRTTLYSYC